MEPNKRMNIYLPAEMLESAKILAIREHKSLSQVIRELLAAWLDKKVPAK